MKGNKGAPPHVGGKRTANHRSMNVERTPKRDVGQAFPSTYFANSDAAGRGNVIVNRAKVRDKVGKLDKTGVRD